MRLIIAFSPDTQTFKQTIPEFESEWTEAGFQRGIVLGETFRLDEGGIPFSKFADARLLSLADVRDEEHYGSEDPSGEEFFDPVREENADILDDFEPGEGDDSLGEDEADSKNIAKSEVEPDDKANETEATDDFVPLDKDLDEAAGNLDDSDRSDQDLVREAKAASRLLVINPDEDQYWANFSKRRSEMLKPGGPPPLFFMVDRLVTGKATPERIRESLEAAFDYGKGRLWIFVEGEPVLHREPDENGETQEETVRIGQTYSLDSQEWTLVGFSRRLCCEDCGLEYPAPEPKLFSFNSPLGACPLCEGFGNLMELDLNLVVPNKNKSLRDGAIAPWNGSSYKHKLAELLVKANENGVRTDVPFSELTRDELRFVLNGSRESGYEGLNGFFIRLQKQKYKMHIRVFLSRWRSYRQCPLCHGTRLRPEALAVRIGEQNIYDLSTMRISEFLKVVDSWELTPWQRQLGQTSLTQVRNRLAYLEEVGLGYLTMDRLVRTLSEGEQRRVNLTSVLGSNLVDVLYVLDEPSIGLHPQDTQKLLDAILRLR
ncbi:MAG: hypothetical protein Q4G59_12210, partial [Planctomycetia bacterium]|nr:hypothetical protein [Planctomycetia bacterium]